MSFPLPRSRAVAGKLGAGDRVDVIVVESDTGRSGYVATNVEVLGTDGGNRGPLGSGDDVTITVAVDGDTAPRLASALEVGTVSLVRATGAGALPDAEPFAPTAGASAQATAASP